MSEAITLRYTVPPRMVRRAMTSWARPPRPKKWYLLRAALVVLIGGLIGAGAAASGALSIMPDSFWLGAVAGLYAGLLLWVGISRRQMARVARLSTGAMDRAGETWARFDAGAFSLANDFVEGRYAWPALDAVTEMKDATILRMGGIVSPVPDASLPDGLSPDAFRRQIRTWWEAAR